MFKLYVCKLFFSYELVFCVRFIRRFLNLKSIACMLQIEISVT